MEDVRKALKEISGFVVKTPLLKSPEFSKALGCDLFFKYEHIQVAGSIKARGAFLKLLSLQNLEAGHGVVTASTGNHGLCVALAANSLGRLFKLFMPTTTAKVKIDRARALGADIALFGTSWDDANQAAVAFSKEMGWEYVHTFDDEIITAGHATAAYEALQEGKRFDVALCSIGGGGIAKGFLGYLKDRLPSIRCYGVETLGAESMMRSVVNGEVSSLPKITSKASSLGVRAPALSTFEFAKKQLTGLAAVSDQAAGMAQMDILNNDKQLVELAASCCVAALQNDLIPDIKNKRVLVLLCGGNAAVSDLNDIEKLEPKRPIYVPINGNIAKTQIVL